MGELGDEGKRDKEQTGNYCSQFLKLGKKQLVVKLFVQLLKSHT